VKNADLDENRPDQSVKEKRTRACKYVNPNEDHSALSDGQATVMRRRVLSSVRVYW